MTPAETSQPATAETNGLTRVQKFAVLLLMLGTDTAAQVLKNCDENELEAVSVEMAQSLSDLADRCRWYVDA